eukprot:CAMPEP_0196806688 /NCGR_PEP_ID=MMETSP1362-20130617/6598_1 /TAXON_ID=163516 /ORGANISM="Leptocylindrus danicus, Strain CCMP1856" /LENGTH=609 /DNA_ID=CAMNT_0042180285 /DNA_START=26 /DNA_END=1855 /DNA_ORIENTATION=+
MKHQYAIRLHHRKSNDSPFAWDRYKKSQDEQLLRTEQDFLTLASSLASELPHLDLNYSFLDDCLCCEGDDNTDIDRGDGFRATQLTWFLESILTIPEVISSKALSHFFSSVNVCTSRNGGDLNDQTSISKSVKEEEEQQHLYRYIVADCDALNVELPIRGTHVHYEELPLNYFVIWSVHIESTNGLGPVYPLQFKISILDGAISARGDDNGKIHVVYEEALNQEEKSDFVGSFQYTDEKRQEERSNEARERAIISLSFTNGNFLRSMHAEFKVKVVPKEVHDVACLAASEQSLATNRKDNAPLLRELLDSATCLDPVKILVDSIDENDVHESQDTLHNELSREAADCKRDAALEGLQRLKCERKLASIEKEMHETQIKLNEAIAEKRIWSKSKTAIYEEVSKLSIELEREKRENQENLEKLNQSVQENIYLRAELSMLRGKSREIAMLREELDTRKIQNEESLESQVKMKKEVNLLQKETERLGDALERERRRSRDAILHAKAEADEARMMQRILEGKLREYENALAKPKHSVPTNWKTSLPSQVIQPASPEKQLIDKEKIQQLKGLRERHTKLSELVKQDPKNEKNYAILIKIEEAMNDILADTSKRL